jgi:hypothetical protein
LEPIENIQGCDFGEISCHKNKMALMASENGFDESRKEGTANRSKKYKPVLDAAISGEHNQGK